MILQKVHIYNGIYKVKENINMHHGKNKRQMKKAKNKNSIKKMKKKKILAKQIQTVNIHKQK